MQSKNGVVMAVVGLDSSGKTVVVDRLVTWLSGQVKVRRMHYGYASGTLITSPLRAALAARRLVGGKRRAGSDSANHSVVGSGPATSSAPVPKPASTAVSTAVSTPAGNPAEDGPLGWFAGVRFLALAYERRRLLVRAFEAADDGVVVILERWYSLASGKMDSPRLDTSTGNALKRLMARKEHRLYATSPDPDFILHLRVSEAVAIERNRARTDVIDDSDEQISLRFRLHSNLPYRCVEQMEIENDGDIERTMERIREHTRALLERSMGCVIDPAPSPERADENAPEPGDFNALRRDEDAR